MAPRDCAVKLGSDLAELQSALRAHTYGGEGLLGIAVFDGQRGRAARLRTAFAVEANVGDAGEGLEARGAVLEPVGKFAED